MSEEQQEDIERLSPQKLTVNFSKGRLFFAIIVGIIAHIVLIGGSSMKYIYVTWVNPDAAIEEKEEEKEKPSEASDAKLGKEIAEAAGVGGTNAAAGDASSSESQDPYTPTAAQAQSKQMQEITSLPEEGEIPENVDDLGLSIEDTSI